MPGSRLLSADLDHVLAQTRPLWEDLRGGQLFITGGTGFFGCWLLETFLWANDHLQLEAQATVLTRNPDAFKRKAPHLASDRAVRLITGDVLTVEFPSERFSHVVHAAYEVDARLSQEAPLRVLDTAILGTRRVLDFVRRCGARKFLLTSSGAVYGSQPEELEHFSEEQTAEREPVNPSAAYAEGKRTAELLAILCAREAGFDASIARCFAFLGPYMPLEGSFAVGNFVRDAMAGGPIVVKGTGQAVRSYMYAADLAIWLWTILFRGSPARPYNVGSELPLTTAELAAAIALEAKVEVALRPQPHAHTAANRYVPSTRRAEVELGLRATVPLQQAIRRTLDWYHSMSPTAVQ